MRLDIAHLRNDIGGHLDREAGGQFLLELFHICTCRRKRTIAMIGQSAATAQMYLYKQKLED